MNADPQTIAQFMVTELETLSPGMEIGAALSQLLEKRISGAPVLDDTGELVGILTTKDCFRAALNAAYYKQWGGTVADYMSVELETMDTELDIVSAAERFLATPFRRFPVLKEGQLVGLLSRSDLLAAFEAFS